MEAATMKTGKTKTKICVPVLVCFSSQIVTEAFTPKGQEQGSDVMSQAAELCPGKDKGKQLSSFFKERFESTPAPETGRRKKKTEGRFKKKIPKNKSKNKRHLTELLYITPVFVGTQNDRGNLLGK